VGRDWDELNQALVKDKGLRGRLFGVLGSSLALGDHLVAHPDSWHLLAGAVTLPSADELHAAFAEVAENAEIGRDTAAAVSPSRKLYRDRLLVLAALDLASTVENEPVLAFATVGEHLSSQLDGRKDAGQRQGCAHCCKQSVLIYAPEAFAIAAQIRERPEVAAIRGATEKLSAAAPDSDTMRRISCPLLSNNSCSIYEFRPLNCRAFVAVDVRECIATFVMMGKFAVRMPTPITNMRTFWHMLMMAALRLAGKDVAVYEMNAAVSRVLETPDAEARWLAGDDVFEGLAQDLPMAPEIGAEIGRMVAFVAPTMERV